MGFVEAKVTGKVGGAVALGAAVPLGPAGTVITTEAEDAVAVGDGVETEGVGADDAWSRRGRNWALEETTSRATSATGSNIFVVLSFKGRKESKERVG